MPGSVESPAFEASTSALSKGFQLYHGDRQMKTRLCYAMANRTLTKLIISDSVAWHHDEAAKMSKLMAYVVIRPLVHLSPPDLSTAD